MNDCSKLVEKIADEILKDKDNVKAIEFTTVIGKLLRENGVTPICTEYVADGCFDNKLGYGYKCCFEKLDFSEHDKVFADRIVELLKKNDNLVKMINELQLEKVHIDCELYDAKQRIAELESKETEKQTKINLNDRIKVKLTPLGAEIYYHQYDELNKKIKANGGTQLEPLMPQIDKDGYTEFQLWHFMELYGEHIGMCKKNVIEPLDIIIAE